MRRFASILWTIFAVMLLSMGEAYCRKPQERTVYMTYILHGNMNYDRYVRPVIWKEFPVIYDNLLTFMDEHPDFKGQIQFSGQTFGSLLQTAPEVIEHAKKIHARGGQLNFTGTFYSEPVNVNMDGETNYRCAWLGTRIIEDNIGHTDGFYLQERAYHPQLPWILNHSGVSWTPVITNDGSWFPFRLKGLDGSVSVCVPVTRDDFIQRVESAPENALITIEEDYEIPQTFFMAYNRVRQFNETHPDIRIEWITVEEYIRRFGIRDEKFIDHCAMADSPDRGTYSRWTADPLDIVVQHHTNMAMNDFRLANAVDALSCNLLGIKADVPLEESGITMTCEPLAWNIEKADLYPEHEKYLMREGRTTVLSKADHLLLWAVNSDAKGWFPLYEKRRERMNSLENSSNLSRYVINKVIESLASGMESSDYDGYYIVVNPEAERMACVEIDVDEPCLAYEISTGALLRSNCVSDGRCCRLEAEVHLPEYGYTVIGIRRTEPNRENWIPGHMIEHLGISVRSSGDTLVVDTPQRRFSISLEPFYVKALAYMDAGELAEEWRESGQYGQVRTSVCLDGIYPKMKMEWQPDYLVHVCQIITLKDRSLECSMTFEFPHPTVVRKVFIDGGRTNFRPEGLDLVVDTSEPCHVGYDIPFGISEISRPGMSYLCALTSCFLNFENGGLLVCPGTGEQAFSLNADEGRLTMFLGTSTTSGPIREMGLTIPDQTTAIHDFEWYAEPFHGTYTHKYSIIPFERDWQNAHVPAKMRAVNQAPYIRRICPGGGKLPYRCSVIEGLPSNVEITSISLKDGKLEIRVNEREGRETSVRFKVGNKTFFGKIPAFGIVTL